MAEFISQPKDPLLPFIAYGSFKPNQLRYNQIKDFVDSCEKIEITGEILDKDGIPIFVRESKYGVYYEYQAFVITFKKGREEEAYEIICKNEPQTYYQWEVWDNRNLLTGKRHLRGTCHYPEYSWDFRDDPYFFEGLTAVDAISRVQIESSRPEHAHITEFFGVSSAYMLLWTIIERFCTLKYGNLRPTEKLKRLSEEPGLRNSLISVRNQEDRPIVRSDSTGTKLSASQDGSNPLKTLNYYYGIRSNMVHRGKDAITDIGLIRSALYNVKKHFLHILDDHNYRIERSDQ